MDIRKLQRAIVDGLEDVKAQHIVVFNTEHLSPLFERVIVASGTSNRQTKALAASVRDAVKSSGQQVLRTEGEDNGEWIIVDCGAAVAHIMQPAIRDYYRLEEIWGGKPVKLKLADDKATLPKASDDQNDGSAASQAAAKKAAARKTATAASAAGKAALAGAARKARAAKAEADEAPAPAASRKPTAARRVSSGVTTAAKTTAAQAAATKKAPARKAASKSAPTKTAGTKTPARKTAAPATPTKVKTLVVGAPVRKPAAKTAAKKAPAKKTAARRP